MAQFIAYRDGIEVSGQHILTFLNCLGSHREKAQAVLQKHGIDSPEPRNWYPQQAWLDGFKELAGSLHANTLTFVGRKIPENAVFPPEIKEISLALKSIDWSYHLHHRADGKPLFNYATGEMLEGIGHYLYEKNGNNRIIMTCTSPYPCDFDRGMIDSIAFRFRLPGTMPRVSHAQPDQCRDTGHDSCSYIVEW